LKKSESPKINYKAIALFAAISLVSAGAYALNRFADSYITKSKTRFERYFLDAFDQEIKIGDYKRLDLFGVYIGETEAGNKSSENFYLYMSGVKIRLFPIKSLIHRKLSIGLIPVEAKIVFKAEKDKQILSLKNKLSTNNRNLNLYVDLLKDTSININKSAIDTNISGRLKYDFGNSSFFSFVNARAFRKGSLSFKGFFNIKNKSYDFRLKSDKFLVNNYLIHIGQNNDNKNDLILNAKINTNLHILSNKDRFSCNGNASIKSLNIAGEYIEENIISDQMQLKCNKKGITLNPSEITYGKSKTKLKAYLPTTNNNNILSINSISRLTNNNNFKFSTNTLLPIKINNGTFNIGNINTKFTLDRLKIPNNTLPALEGLSGFIDFKGDLSGDYRNIKTNISFGLDYPEFEGLKLREKWLGDIYNENNILKLKMKNINSSIPSFITANFIDFKLEELTFSRLINNKYGELKLSTDKNFLWSANDFPLEGFEYSLSPSSDFKRISGVLNGDGLIDFTTLFIKGDFYVDNFKLGELNLDKAFFKGELSNQEISLYANLYPEEGGKLSLNIDYKKELDKYYKVSLSDIPTNWITSTISEVFEYNKANLVPEGSAKDIGNLNIANEGSTIDKITKEINKLKLSGNDIEPDIDPLKELIDNSIGGLINGDVVIKGKDNDNLYIDSRLKMYLYKSNSVLYQDKENNSIKLEFEGGISQGTGKIDIINVPLYIIDNLTKKEENLEGRFSIKGYYDLNSEDIELNVRTFNASINKIPFNLEKGKVNIDDSNLSVDFILDSDVSELPVILIGSIPINPDSEYNLILEAHRSSIKLFNGITKGIFEFKEGEADFRVILRGTRQSPQANGYFVLRDSQIVLLNKNLSKLNATILFDFDSLNIINLTGIAKDEGSINAKGTIPLFVNSEEGNKSLEFQLENIDFKIGSSQFEVNSNLIVKGSLKKPIFSGDLDLSNGIISIQNNKKDKSLNENSNILENNYWPESKWDKNSPIEIISNESNFDKNIVLNIFPDYLKYSGFDNFYLSLGSNLKIQYPGLGSLFLETPRSLKINGFLEKGLNAYGVIKFIKGRINLYTTPFKLDKNNKNVALFIPSNGFIPYVDIKLTNRVPDPIYPINVNNENTLTSTDTNSLDTSESFGAFGIGDTRFVKVEASYEGFLDQLSLEDNQNKITLRSVPSLSRSHIIGLISGNSANLLNRAFISQVFGSTVFSDRFQLSLYPARIDVDEKDDNIFYNEAFTKNNIKDTENLEEDSAKQAWIAEMGLDITDNLNFSIQATTERNDIPPQGILSLQANPYLEFLGSFDFDGIWKSQMQIFFRY
tara:strand:+ start:8869 stop:12837 length:3969 start_codon:yes stop_codon:yes gene_type:complete